MHCMLAEFDETLLEKEEEITHPWQVLNGG